MVQKTDVQFLLVYQIQIIQLIEQQVKIIYLEYPFFWIGELHHNTENFSLSEAEVASEPW